MKFLEDTKSEKEIGAIVSCFFVISLFVFSLGNEVVAQSIDQDLIKQYQNIQKTDLENQDSLLNQSRNLNLSPEEIEAHEKAKIAAELISEMSSRLEEDYQSRIGELDEEDEEKRIKQFGYDIFSKTTISPNDSLGQIPDNYILGIGDELIISMVGAIDSTRIVKVDREGRVVLNELSPVQAMGRSLGDFKSEIRDKVASSMLGTEVFVSLGNIRRIGVFVLGEVSIPGLHNLTSLSSVLQALTSAGGVKKTGSLRNIRIEKNGNTQVLDVYQMLKTGEGASISLTDGTRIFVPLIGESVAVSGQVVRPAIYELKNNEIGISGKELLNLAGGGLRVRGNDFLVNHIGEDGVQKISSVSDLNGSLVGNDILQVFYKRDIKVGEVTLTGHVRVPGNKSLDAAPTISRLLNGTDSLGREPYLPLAVLETTDEISRARILKAVNLENILSELEDIKLKDRDELFVLGAEDVSFLSDIRVREIIVTGEVPDNSCSALEYLGRFTTSGDENRFSSVTRSVFTSKEDFEEDLKTLEKEEKGLDNPNIESQELELPSSPEEGIEDFEKIKNEEEMDCNEFFDQNPEILTFSLENAVSTTGAVRRPGVYPVANSATLSTLIASAGGFSNTADLSNIEVLSFLGEVKQINSSTTKLENINIISGSSIRVASEISNSERGTVLLTGEFNRPGIYSISRGETLSQIIERAGGLTDFAFPYGATLTKRSVREQQQESFKRAAREINGALAVAAVRANLEAGTLTAAQNLSKELETVEAAGRIVVEADPTVLRVKKELDTILDSGDSFDMPKRPNFVTVSGDVLNPSALQFIPGKKINNYLAEAGGYQRSADKKRVYVVYPNGIAEPVKKSMWSSNKIMLPPGSTIVVPKNLKTFSTLDMIRDVATIVGQLALSAASVAVVTN